MRYTIQFTEDHEERVTPPIQHPKGEIKENCSEGTMRHFCDKGVAVVIETPKPEPVVEKKPEPVISSASPAAPASPPRTVTLRGKQKRK